MALITTPAPDHKASPLALWFAGAAGLVLVYAVIFVTTEDTPVGPALLQGAGNVAPLVVLAAGVRVALRRWVVSKPVLVQAVWHLALAALFTPAWYASSRLLLAVAAMGFGDRFHLTGFSGPALAWQLFQGLVLYAVVAAVTYAERRSAEVPGADGVAAAAAPRSLDRYLIRAGEDFRPVEVGEIVTITGAQDYSEVATAKGRHLVRLSLSEFEARLDPARFIRVHRSTIICLAHLERAELAGGGRMLAHMTNGEAVPVSRAGVKALRPLIV